MKFTAVVLKRWKVRRGWLFHNCGAARASLTAILAGSASAIRSKITSVGHALGYLFADAIAFLILASISSVMYPQSKRMKTEV